MSITPAQCAAAAEQALLDYLKALDVMDTSNALSDRQEAARALEMLGSKLGLILARVVGPQLAAGTLDRCANNTLFHGRLQTGEMPTQ